MEKLILVIYIGVQGIRSEDIEEYVHKISHRITPQTIEGEFIMIPTQSLDTRIECINPKYITNTELIQEHTEMMKKLQEELQHQLKQLKQENNE
jgi:galactitol-specific phosphotransferase system IIB component